MYMFIILLWVQSFPFYQVSIACGTEHFHLQLCTCMTTFFGLLRNVERILL